MRLKNERPELDKSTCSLKPKKGHSLDPGDLLEALAKHANGRSAEVLRFAMGEKLSKGERSFFLDCDGVADTLERVHDFRIVDGSVFESCQSGETLRKPTLFGQPPR